MSAPKNPSSYPSQFFDLIQAVGAEGHDVEVPVKDKPQGTVLRASFYNFRAALRTADAKSESLQMASGVRVTIVSKPDPDTTTLHWFVRFSTFDSAAEMVAVE